jgi:thiamine biosynthesis lipoprotein
VIERSPAGGASRRVEHLWGTAITVDVREPCPAERIDEVFAWFRRVDDLFSTWRPDSEISRLGRRELRLAEVSPDVREVLELCDQVNEESHGAFDIRVGADPRVVPREGLGPIDPSGLVKGWALQRAGEQLRRAGLGRFAINAGGDVITAGRPTPDAGWRVGIQHPWQRDKVALVLEVSDLGVATSGRYERGDHILDPRTGMPATKLQSVTVVHADLALADGYATAALVLGDEGAAWLAERGLAGLTIDNDEMVTRTGTLVGTFASGSAGASPGPWIREPSLGGADHDHEHTDVA